MLRFLMKHKLLYMLPIAYGLYNLAFKDISIFWYMYTFALLILMSAAVLFGEIQEEMRTWKSFAYGIAAAIAMYLILFAGYHLLQMLGVGSASSTADFLAIFTPASVWHLLLLMFIVVPGEELFWRGFVQQQLKQYVPASIAIPVASVLFGLTLWLADFWPGIFAGTAVGLVLGYLYEKKKSMPALIIAHLILMLLIFIVFPF
ncbi:CPBP family intramembrane glutamic endopeptidase [Planococcus halotolerans]|uniref:CPBP family intramembrane metalloprotease n=1 Tax=Planococcus halotolerans TaxID=2233542 RepID=A0A365L1X5_9BACL|nr:type II CAAX endopeptidase family protein [Planococcus halotolerans]QHJ70798.1 CPBP family intramembrane metalloprotease [Planococcus halotolerans]RAZ79446.1 CPBP family intramembrane metalloprotease [Planococcus halotolerans]